MGGSSHDHDFHGLFWTFGPAGRQDVHLHPCDIGSCEYEMVGPGLKCDGTWATHVPKLLTSRSKWGQKDQEGKPLGRRKVRVATNEGDTDG